RRGSRTGRRRAPRGGRSSVRGGPGEVGRGVAGGRDGRRGGRRGARGGRESARLVEIRSRLSRELAELGAVALEERLAAARPAARVRDPATNPEPARRLLEELVRDRERPGDRDPECVAAGQDR